MTTEIIAVTGPHKRFPVAWWATRFMLKLCGLKSIYLTARSPQPKVAIAGIIIGGGDDIEPIQYGMEVAADYRYDRERDHFEMTMIRRALHENIPVLGICRGAQLINVVANGSLHQDIRAQRKITSNRRYITPIKWVDLETGSRLQKTLGVDKLKVNSLHNQAVDRIGEGLSVIARDQDGFVQAIEGHFGFLLGVQWHPEYLPYKSAQRQLFKLFANAVRQTGNRLELPRY